MKKLFLIILILLIGGSILSNIRRQLVTLNEAKKTNKETEAEVIRYRQTNQILGLKIEYATSSAFLEQKMRDKLALGSKNDVWLMLKSEEKLDLFPKTNEAREIPKIRQWINMFTQ